jgi:DnaJ-class molecular chaperone
MEPKKCPSCGGSGELATSHRFTCYSCDGKGSITDPDRYAEAVRHEQDCYAQLARSVSVSEYRQMGG